MTPLGALGDYLLRREGEWREAEKAPSKKLVMMLTVGTCGREGEGALSQKVFEEVAGSVGMLT